MSFESILGTPANCPDCKNPVSSDDKTCPGCGFPLKKSVFEEEALRYQKEANTRTANKALWAKVAFFILTALCFIVSFMAFDEYQNPPDDLLPSEIEDTYSLLIMMSTLTIIFLALTILCFFKPLAASIAGLVICSSFMALALIGLTDDSSVEIDSTIIVFFLILAVFPALMIKTIYDLTERQYKFRK